MKFSVMRSTTYKGAVAGNLSGKLSMIDLADAVR